MQFERLRASKGGLPVGMSMALSGEGLGNVWLEVQYPKLHRPGMLRLEGAMQNNPFQMAIVPAGIQELRLLAISTNHSAM